MVSVSKVAMNATQNFKPAKEEDLVSDIAKLRIKSTPLERELKELEAEVIKTPEIWARIDELRRQIQEIQKQINQKQTLLEEIRAEKERNKDKAGGKDPAEEPDEAQAEKNPYARIFKTDVSVLADAEHKLNEDPLKVLTKKGTLTAMDEPTTAAALLVERDGEEEPTETVSPGASTAAPALAGSSEKDEGETGADAALADRRSETSEREAAPAEKRRRSLLDRLEEAQGR